MNEEKGEKRTEDEKKMRASEKKERQRERGVWVCVLTRALVCARVCARDKREEEKEK